jgi:tetratricopeptide (TPR) repeat protein
MSRAVACPQCRMSLTSARPLAESRPIRCPHCGTHFVPSANKVLGEGPAISPPPPPPATPPPAAGQPPSRGASRGALMLAAVAAGAVLLLAGGIYAMIRLVPEREPVAPRDDEQSSSAEAASSPETQRLDEERKKLDKERAAFELEKKRHEFDRLMARGEVALAKQQAAAAQEAYQAALRLFPEEEGAVTGLAEARAAILAAEKAAARDKEDREKRQAEVARLRQAGQEALAQKKYAEAVRALEGARLLAPDDEAVTAALAEAQAALDKDTAEKKKLAEYQKHMDAGKAALDAGKFEEAVKEFKTAGEVIPGDGDALISQKVAEGQLAAVKDFEKRVAAHKDLMERGQAALQAKHYSEAVSLLTQAQKLFPQDKPTIKALKAARLSLAQGRQQYGDLMEKADEALQALRFEEAHRLYAKALEVLPDDPAAQRGRQAAADAIQNIAAGRAAYVRFMLQGQEAMQTLRFFDAVRNFREALRLVPGDPSALRGLRDAEIALGPAALLAPVVTPPLANLAGLLATGKGALDQRKYADAVRAFTEALRIAPDNAQAQAGLHQAKYGQAMADGQAALVAGRAQAAIGFFEAALKEMPGDVAATAGLRQARALKQ